MPLESRKHAQEQEWDLITIPVLSGGLNTRSLPELIDAQETPKSENLSFREERVRSDIGHALFADAKTGTTAGVFQHRDASGATQLILVTQETFYKYNSTNDVWEYVPAGVSGDGNFTLSVGEIATATVMRLTNTTGFTATNRIAVALDDGTQHQTTIVSIVANVSITLTVGIPSAAAAGNAIFEPPMYAGDDDNQVVFVPVPEKEWTAFTNGVDKPQRFDGTTVELIPNLPSSGNIICRTMVMFKNTLCLYNIIEAGTEKPYLVIWSDVGNVEEWVLGDASNNPLVDARDDIVAVRPLGQDIIIYRKKSIVRQEFVGAAFELFRFRTMVFGEVLGAQGVGAVSPNGVFALTDQHVIFAQEGVYLYQGGNSVRLISEKIFSGTFDIDGDVDPDKTHRSFVQFFDRLNELFCFYADINATFPNKALILDAETFTWRKRKFQSGLEYTSSNLRVDSAATGVQIQNLVGTIIEQTFSLGGAAIGGGIPSVLVTADITAGATSAVYKFDATTPGEAGTDIDWFLETKDFRAVDRFWRLDWLEIKAKGPAITVSVSFNGGATFISMGNTVATSTMTKTRFFSQNVSESIRFRFSGSGAGIEIGTIYFKIREEGRWDL